MAGMDFSDRLKVLVAVLGMVTLFCLTCYLLQDYFGKPFAGPPHDETIFENMFSYNATSPALTEDIASWLYEYTTPACFVFFFALPLIMLLVELGIQYEAFQKCFFSAGAATVEEQMEEKKVHDFLDLAKHGKWNQVLKQIDEDPKLINRMASGRFSVLHYACWQGKAKTVQTLLDKGADTEAVAGATGKKPYEVTRDAKIADMVRYFRSRTTKDDSKAGDSTARDSTALLAGEDDPPNAQHEEDELEMATIWVSFAKEYVPWCFGPLYVFVLFVYGRRNQDLSRTIRAVQRKALHSRQFRFCIGLVAASWANLGVALPFILHSYPPWGKFTLENKYLSPVEFYPAVVYCLLITALFVLQYSDYTFERLIGTRQKEVMCLSERDNQDTRTLSDASDKKRDSRPKDDPPLSSTDSRASTASSGPPHEEATGGEDDHTLLEMIQKDSKVKVHSAKRAITLLQRYFGTHFNDDGPSEVPCMQQILFWILSVIVALPHALLPRCWMSRQYGSPEDPIIILPGDHAGYQYVNAMLLMNFLVVVAIMAFFVQQIMLTNFDFERVLNQLTILDAVTTYGYDILSPARQLQVKHIAWANFEDLKKRKKEPGGLAYLKKENIDVFISRPAPDAGPRRKRESEKLEMRGLKPPLEVELGSPRGICCWWRVRQWLALDVLDERITMEMYLTFLLLNAATLSFATIFWYVNNGHRVTLLVALAMYDVAGIIIFVMKALNVCVEVNETMMQDASMLAEVKYYFIMEGVNPDKTEVTNLLDVLASKIQNIDKLQKVFGIEIDSKLRAGVFSAVFLGIGGTLLEWLRSLVPFSISKELLNHTRLNI